MSQSLRTIEYDTKVSCIITNIGIEKSQEVAKRDGWHIYPSGFGVSETRGEFSSNRTGHNDLWYQGVLSGRKIYNSNTIAFICTLPPNASKTSKDIREIYLFCEDENRNQFTFAIGQCDSIYKPGETVSLNIIITLLNLNVIETFKIVNTIVNDLAIHNEDPNSHRDIRNSIGNTVGNIVVTDISEYKARIGDIVCVNCSEGTKTVILPVNPENGQKVTVIDISMMANYNNISVKPSKNQQIDSNDTMFVLNASGAWVTFLWYSRLNNWVVDLGGRNNTPTFYRRKTPLLYTNYFNSGLSYWSDHLDYNKGDIVIGSDSNLYIATTNHGITNNSSQDPILEDSLFWTPFSNNKIVIKPEIVSKGFAINTPPYTIGKNQISVYIDGIRCNCGKNTETDTFYEENKTIGSRGSKIYFNDSIPNTFDIMIVRE